MSANNFLLNAFAALIRHATDKPNVDGLHSMIDVLAGRIPQALIPSDSENVIQDQSHPLHNARHHVPMP